MVFILFTRSWLSEYYKYLQVTVLGTTCYVHDSTGVPHIYWLDKRTNGSDVLGPLGPKGRYTLVGRPYRVRRPYKYIYRSLYLVDSFLL